MNTVEMPGRLRHRRPGGLTGCRAAAAVLTFLLVALAPATGQAKPVASPPAQETGRQAPVTTEKTDATTSTRLPISIVAVPSMAVSSDSEADTEIRELLEELVAATEEAAASLGRFDLVEPSVSLKAGRSVRRLEVRLLSFEQERVWIEAEDDAEDGSGADSDSGTDSHADSDSHADLDSHADSDDKSNDSSDNSSGNSSGNSGFWFRLIIRLFFGTEPAKPIGAEDGHWEWYTTIRVGFRLLDRKNQSVEQSVRLEGETYALTKSGSKSRAISAVEDQLRLELRRMYLLRSPVAFSSSQHATVQIGSDVGVQPRQLFMLGPGSGSAVGRVSQVGANSSRLRVVRRWSNEPHPSTATELLTGAMELRLSGSATGLDRPEDFGTLDRQQPFGELGFTAGTFGRVFLSSSFRAGTVTDSRNQSLWLIGVDVAPGVYLYRSPTTRVGAMAGGGLDIVFNTDDADQDATAWLGSFWPAVETSLVLSKHLDLLTRVGYRFSMTTDSWKVTPAQDEEESESENVESVPATWDGAAPSVTTGGAFLTLGLKFVVF